MSEEELLSIISGDLKNPITKDQIWTEEIKISHLKKIDKIFNKGIQYYLDPSTPEKNKEASIFFRKTELGGELNLGAKQIVNQFEETSLSLSALAKLSDVKFERVLPNYSVTSSPKQAGKEIREKLNPIFKVQPKEFLVELIRVLGYANIIVFEYVEHHAKIEKSNIDGFYIKPNNIVLKRNQRFFRREIFTLIHELGHYLLDEEVAEEVNYNSMQAPINKIERWCNEFAYYFLVAEYDKMISNVEFASPKNDYHHDLITEVSSKTHLSRTALMTRLLINEKISPAYYQKFKKNLQEEFEAKREEEKKKRELDKEMGVKTFAQPAVPIKSPLVISTYQKAYFEGAISEYEFCQKLNIKSENFERYIYDSSN
ncbi:ImmA/IrrE family metallo-endopeptidase [Chryseobacterium sp. R2A-55]|uniref:ImmA/IrrE family metallo-endopeptidase n=1 Tax=Chryseobacterium sp. R2A-55 TaxID=2744445 RepID=UPI001F205470|nr:ImmA/IrrE family metallo-endopeptidase [Chryseobacterium sp. R2A-55]